MKPLTSKNKFSYYHKTHPFFEIYIPPFINYNDKYACKNAK